MSFSGLKRQEDNQFRCCCLQHRLPELDEKLPHLEPTCYYLHLDICLAIFGTENRGALILVLCLQGCKKELGAIRRFSTTRRGKGVLLLGGVLLWEPEGLFPSLCLPTVFLQVSLSTSPNYFSSLTSL